ncbi:MAG TPA: response regulator transcription factor [Gemmatimonadales bacterium]|nr:response regulator transcription factor [Gemmatimonadales bacterium]
MEVYTAHTRVVLADDHPMLRQGVRALLERHGIEVVAEASDGRAAAEAARQLHPDVAVLDIMMPVLNGIDAARQIADSCPETHVVLLTALEQERLVTEAVHAGARGFVLKTQVGEDLLHAIEQVSRGGFYVGAGVSQAVVEACRMAAAEDGARLTSRERQVVQLVAEGKSTKQIAALLAITPKTAEFHRARVMKKLDVHDVASLVRYAIREGLITP